MVKVIFEQLFLYCVTCVDLPQFVIWFRENDTNYNCVMRRFLGVPKRRLYHFFFQNKIFNLELHTRLKF